MKPKRHNDPPSYSTEWVASLARQYLNGSGRLTEAHVRALARFALDIHEARRFRRSRYDIAAEAQGRKRETARAVDQRRKALRVVSEGRKP
jgi:hypothetical protein